MSEFLEVGFWLFIFIALALRNVANKAKQAGRDQAISSSGDEAAERARLEAERVMRERAEQRRRESGARREGPGRREGSGRREGPGRRESAGRRDPRERAGRSPTRRSGQPGRAEPEKRGSILGSFADLAREIERQMQDAADAGREREEPERTVVVPGRRVDPGESPTLYDATGPVAIASGATPAKRPLRSAEPEPEAGRSRRRAGGRGLERLERYDPLKRAVLLSEILGTPPGLSEGERRLGRWDPS